MQPEAGHRMTTIRTTSLALGASLLGSALALSVAPSQHWRYLAIALIPFALLFLFVGTGLLESILASLLRYLRRRCPAVAVLSDLPWDDGTRFWACADMDASAWSAKIGAMAKQHGNRIAVHRIRITGPLAKLRLHRYNAIVNPYGSAYPESDIKEMPVWNSLLDYVLNGGLVACVADIPFSYAYDPKRRIPYPTVKSSYQYIPDTFRLQSDNLIQLEKAQLRPIAPYRDSPFLSQTRVDIINTEEIPKDTQKLTPKNFDLVFRPEHYACGGITSATVHRALVLDNEPKSTTDQRLTSVTQPLPFNDHSVTPIFFVSFGTGKFLASLLFLDHPNQSKEVRDRITDLQCALVLNHCPTAAAKLRTGARPTRQASPKPPAPPTAA